MVECTIEIKVIDYPGIISEAYNAVLNELFKRAISNRPDFHDTRGCNGKYIWELFGNGGIK